MADDASFAVFLTRLRAGDEQMAEELVRRYEPLIRVEVRRRLRDVRLRRLFDSLDICQSVLSGFLAGAAGGQYELDGPQELLRLLVSMTRNKLAFHVRKARSQRRDHRRVTDHPLEELAGAPTGDPSRLAEGKDLLSRFRLRLSPEERDLADLRGQGYAWAEIAARVGGTPHGRRMQLARALDRARQQLAPDEVERE
jgi:RNA polymerase sigma-70 factor (ECF subfamily)